MDITKKKDGDAWRVYFNKKPSAFTILKGDKPRYREPQTWDVYRDETGQKYPFYMFDANSLGRALQLLEIIADHVEESLK